MIRNVNLQVESLDDRLVPSATPTFGFHVELEYKPEAPAFSKVGTGHLILPAVQDEVTEYYKDLLNREVGDAEQQTGGPHVKPEEVELLPAVRPEYVRKVYEELLNRDLEGQQNIADFLGGVMKPEGFTGLPAVQQDILDKYYEEFLNRDTGDQTIYGFHWGVMPADEGDERQP